MFNICTLKVYRVIFARESLHQKNSAMRCCVWHVKSNVRVKLFYSLLGVHTIAYAYPNVKIVTAAVDPEVNDKFHIIPGIGEQTGWYGWLSSEYLSNVQAVLFLAEFYPHDSKESSVFSRRAWCLINELYANSCESDVFAVLMLGKHFHVTQSLPFVLMSSRKIAVVTWLD